jgi:hypothetical protein
MGFLSGLANLALGGSGPELQKQIFDNSQVDAQTGRVKLGSDQLQTMFRQSAEQGGLAKQGDLYNAYGALASGQGPNPALALLQQQTGQNNAAQAALMAGQRGVSANPALMSRQIAQQGAMNQQNAIGQGAALQAQQALAAMQAQSGLAGQMVGNQMQAGGMYNDAAQNALNSMLGANQAVNANNLKLSQARDEVKRNNIKSGFDAASGGMMQAAEYFGKSKGGGGGGMMGGQAGGPAAAAGGVMMAAHGGEVEHQEEEISLLDFLSQHPGMIMSSSKHPAPVVPGIPLKKGDHEDNDVVPALLSPGEIVIPRSHAADPKKAAAFARAVAARKEHK